ncbi:hypothetical protein HMI55_004240 [Coelomomyces lativittatus]|nr:hypothetical protein HMI55_004240 [Coelomomyces lativittatus]
MTLPISHSTSKSYSDYVPLTPSRSQPAKVYYFSLALLSLFWSLFLWHICFKLPSPIPAEHATSFVFSEERARQHVHQLSVVIGQRTLPVLHYF